VTGSAGTWRKLGSQHPEEAFQIYFFFFQSEVKAVTKLEGRVCLLKGKRGEVKQKAAEPTDVWASRPKTMLFMV
jgi:hypothetical protein